jgi:hypothetical protein
MKQQRKRSDSDDDVIADGGVVRVPLMLRDGSTVDLEPWQRDVILGARLGLEDGESLHRPGARFCTDAAANEAVAKAYLQSVRELQDAWRHPTRDAGRDDPITGFGSPEFRGGQPGDPCTCRGPEFPLDFGSPGHLERRDGRLVCVPDRERGRENGRSRMDARDEAYVAMCRELENAWRGK